MTRLFSSRVAFGDLQSQPEGGNLMPKDQPPFTEKKLDLFEIYAADPERADELVFDRIPNADRRGFLKGAGLATMGALLGASIPFHRNMPAGFIPEALAATAMEIKGKNGLTILK